MADDIREVDVGDPKSLVYADLLLNNTTGIASGSVFFNPPGLAPIKFAMVNGTISSTGMVSIKEEINGNGVDLAFNEGDKFATVSLKILGKTVYSLHVPVTPVCYCSGTMIKTDRGDVAVEELNIGDMVITASGATRAIRWIGRRDYTGRFANANPELLPVCVKAGAISADVPARDLWVSPKHALFIDGVLIPAASLVNGVTVVKIEQVDALTYWHVELDSHDVLLAEDTPSESFIDDNGRKIFHNAESFHALYPDEAEVEAVYCAPRVESGHLLEGIRRRINMRAGLSISAEEFGHLHGCVESSDESRVTGWAQDQRYPGAPVCLDVLVDGELIALVYADQPRPDLAGEGSTDFDHGFAVDLPFAADRAREVHVRRSVDGVVLRNDTLCPPPRLALVA